MYHNGDQTLVALSVELVGLGGVSQKWSLRHSG